MTTKVIVETHTWPARVSVSVSHHHSTPKHSSNGWSETTTFQEPHTQQEYVCHSLASVRVEELPEGTVSLGNLVADAVLGAAGTLSPEPTPG